MKDDKNDDYNNDNDDIRVTPFGHFVFSRGA